MEGAIASGQVERTAGWGYTRQPIGRDICGTVFQNGELLAEKCNKDRLKFGRQFFGIGFVNKTMSDKNRGLYEKYKVTRVDGSSRKGGKHFGCSYFVLDLTHDPHAFLARSAYADSCRNEYPELAHDLDQKLRLLGR